VCQEKSQLPTKTETKLTSVPKIQQIIKDCPTRASQRNFQIIRNKNKFQVSWRTLGAYHFRNLLLLELSLVTCYNHTASYMPAVSYFLSAIHW